MCPQDVGSFVHACYTSVKKLSQLWGGGWVILLRLRAEEVLWERKTEEGQSWSVR